MSTHHAIDRICAAGIVLALIVTILFMSGNVPVLTAADSTLGYETRLFDPDRVHTLEIIMDDWDSFLETCTSEEYSLCTVLIDNESYRNVGIRGKGNTSLSTVASMDSQRYSFKIEFDHYDSGKNYYGLDKLSLNNIIQDNTYMKDYLTYRMMNEFGVNAPLCSFVWITVNGEEWGLYLAVEGVEDAFLQRNYGTEIGKLYKPDSQSFGGGGPGNGRNFNFSDFLNNHSDESGETSTENTSGISNHSPGMPGDFSSFPVDMSDMEQMPFPPFDGMPPDFNSDDSDGAFPEFFGETDSENMETSGENNGETSGETDSENMEISESANSETSGETAENMLNMGGRMRFGGMPSRFSGAFGGMGSDDVKLKYTDDDFDSYSNIFNNAKTDISDADKSRLIAALKRLGARENIENTVNIDETLRYFVVHNYVCNGDSYTGSIIHNYYLYEHNGQLSMIPWDYNLAFGTFQSADASGMVNDPIDTPMSVTDADDRPMFGWIMENEMYMEQYHKYFADFLNTVDISGMIQSAYGIIAPYVERDPTTFLDSYDKFETGVATLLKFCELRSQSIQGQLDGTIPSTDAGQSEENVNLIDASGITLTDMGSMGGDRGGFGGGNHSGGGPGNGGNNAFSGRRGFQNRETTSDENSDGTAVPETNPDESENPETILEESVNPEINPDDETRMENDSADGQFPGAPGPGGMNFPGGDGNFEGSFPGGNGNFGSNFPSGNGNFPGVSDTAQSPGADTWMILGVSMALLAAGFVIAYRTKHAW